MQIEDSTVWSAVVALLGGIATGVRLIFTRIATLEINTVTRKEFDVLEREVVKKEDFREYAERAETSRAELRDSVAKLFDRIDDLKTAIMHQQPRQ